MPVIPRTSTAALWSALETLVFRYQHTCTVVLARCWPCPSEELWVPCASSSDSCSRETSSEGPGGEIGHLLRGDRTTLVNGALRARELSLCAQAKSKAHPSTWNLSTWT